MVKKKIHVAIIDDGVNTSCFETIMPFSNIEINESLTITSKSNVDAIEDSHGTICTAIFSKYANKRHMIVSSIKILDNTTDRATALQLIKALEWCINQKVDLVSCSLGTTNSKDFEPLMVEFEKLLSKGITNVFNDSRCDKGSF